MGILYDYNFYSMKMCTTLYLIYHPTYKLEGNDGIIYSLFMIFSNMGVGQEILSIKGLYASMNLLLYQSHHIIYDFILYSS
jgi:hypothetical protein